MAVPVLTGDCVSVAYESHLLFILLITLEV